MGKEYFLLKAPEYAKGVLLLKSLGLKRPLSFKEIIQERVNAYEKYNINIHENAILYDFSSYTCTGIILKKSTSEKPSDKAKIISVVESLANIPPDFEAGLIPASYDSVEGIEFSRKGDFEWPLNKEKVLENPGWNAALEGDKALLKAYADIVFYETEGESKSAMGFYLRKLSHTLVLSEEIIPLHITSVDGGSSVWCEPDFFIPAGFLTVIDSNKLIKRKDDLEKLVKKQ